MHIICRAFFHARGAQSGARPFTSRTGTSRGKKPVALRRGWKSETAFIVTIPLTSFRSASPTLGGEACPQRRSPAAYRRRELENLIVYLIAEFFGISLYFGLLLRTLFNYLRGFPRRPGRFGGRLKFCDHCQARFILIRRPQE